MKANNKQPAIIWGGKAIIYFARAAGSPSEAGVIDRKSIWFVSYSTYVRSEQLRVTFLKSKNIQPVANFQQHGREEKDLCPERFELYKKIKIKKGCRKGFKGLAGGERSPGWLGGPWWGCQVLATGVVLGDLVLGWILISLRGCKWGRMLLKLQQLQADQTRASEVNGCFCAALGCGH